MGVVTFGLVTVDLVTVASSASAAHRSVSVFSETSTQSKRLSILYSLSASDAKLTPTSKRGTFTLTLSGTDARTVWFADRPDRDAGSLPTSALVNRWRSVGFASDPPNAAVVLHSPVSISDGRVDTFVVELSNPRKQGRQLSFRAQVLDEESANSLSGRLAKHGDRHDREISSTPDPIRLGGVSIFIDDAFAFVNAALADTEADGSTDAN